MNEGEEGNVFFALQFPEVAIVYSLLYERALKVPSRQEIMDEIERRELYVKQRAIIPQAMDQVEHLQEDMREYMVAFAGEESVKGLEAGVKKMVDEMKRRSG